MNPIFYKQPTEKFMIAMDYTTELEDGETVSSTVITAYEIPAGTDVTATIIDSTSTTDSQARAVIKAGTGGKKYKITFVTTTSLSYIYEDDIEFVVQDD